MRKIVITGPESSGKSTLASTLASLFKGSYTEEQARAYLHKLGRPYEYTDLEQIALQQVESEDSFSGQNGGLLFCDTDLLTIKIWSSHKYAKIAPNVLDLINRRHYDLYLLCKPDIPWEEDPLRENPHDREVLFTKHLDELIHYHKTFEIVVGLNEERTQNAVEIVRKYLKHWSVVENVLEK